MVIEKTPEEFVIRLPISSEMKYIQDVVDYLHYKGLTSGYETGQSEVDALAKEINRGWWNENKSKFVGRVSISNHSIGIIHNHR